MIQPAISQLQDEIAALISAKPGTASWALLQAKSLGMSFLKRADQLKLSDPVDFEALRKRARLEMIQDVKDLSFESLEAAGQEAGVNPVNLGSANPGS